MRRRTAARLSSLTAGLLAAAAGVALLLAPGTPAGAASWAPESSATLTPGVMAYTAGAQCTANFVYTDASGGVYLGYAAHCAGTGSSTDTNGCTTQSLPLGTAVTFTRGGSPAGNGTRLGAGTLAYSSWLTMRSRGEQDANTCAYNDLALVKVNSGDVAKVNPTVPFFGGPNALGTGTTAGQKVYSYGNSSLRGGVSQLSPKIGASLGDSAGGWTTSLYTVTPGIPGDSGSGFLDSTGKAFGVLSTVAIAPLPASNGVGNLRKELTYAQSYSGIGGLNLAAGTRAFSAPA